MSDYLRLDELADGAALEAFAEKWNGGVGPWWGITSDECDYIHAAWWRHFPAGSEKGPSMCKWSP